MKKHLFLSLFLAISATTGIIQTADDSPEIKKPNHITLLSNDGQNITINQEHWKESELLNKMWKWNLEKLPPEERIKKMENLSYADLRKAHALLAFASKFPIGPLPKNPTLDNRKKYGEQVARAAQEFTKKSRYPDISKHPDIFNLADFFSIPVVTQAIAYNLLTPEIDLQTMEREISQSLDPLQTQIADQLEKRISLVKVNYLATGNAQDPYFKGVSIQDLIDHNRIPQFPGGALSLNNQHISSLDGIENIPGLQNLQYLDLSNNRITFIPSIIQGLQNLQYLRLSNNLITTIPANIQGLQSLQNLWLGNNLITTIPANIQGLQSLQRLWLDENQITTIPNIILGLQNLEWFSLRDNPIQQKNIGGITISAQEQIKQLQNKINETRPADTQLKIGY